MNINFSPLKSFVSLNKIAPKNNTTNPIKYTKTLNQDTVSFTGSVDKNSRRISPNLGAKLAKKTKPLKSLEDLEQSKETQIKRYGQVFNSTEQAIERAQNRLADIEKEIGEIIKFQDRPNAAFLYDGSLSRKEIEEELKKHPEFVDINKLQGYFKGLNIEKFFKPDYFFTDKIIDLSYPDNYKACVDLRNVLKGKIILNNSNRKSRLLGKNGIRKRVTANIAGKSYVITYIDEAYREKYENTKRLVPAPSRFVCGDLLSDKPQYIPLDELAKLGYGSKEELTQYYEKGILKGIVAKGEVNGKQISVPFVNLNDLRVKDNLDIARRKNENFYFIEDLAKKLYVSVEYLENAVIEGKLDTINEYIYYCDKDKIGIDLSNPKNKEFLKDKLEEAKEKRAEIALERQRAVDEERELAEQRRYAFGLTSKIAWCFAPKTRQIMSDIAQRDGYAGKVIAKNVEIRAQKKLNPNEGDDEKLHLTKAEEIKLAQYHNATWNEAGTEEYELAYKKAQKIVDLYLEKGIDAITDPVVRRAIVRYNIDNRRR